MRMNRALTPMAAALTCVALAGTFTGCANKKPAATSGGTSAAPGGGTATGPGTITIGEYGSMTGETSTFGTSTDNGVQLAIAAVNAAGGVNGHQLAIKLYDDEGKPDEALTVVKKLIDQDKVTAILGEVASTRSIMAAPACDAAKVPMISPSSTNPKVTTIGPYIFRVCFIDPFQGFAAAKFATEDLKAHTAAILTDAGQDYSTGLTKVFQADFTKNGGKIVAMASYESKDPNFKTPLIQLKAANPDVIYVPGYYGQVGPIARQAREVGLTAPLLGGDGWDSPKLIEGAGGPGKALEGSYFTNHYSPTSPNPLTQKFVAAFQEKFHAVPDSLAAMGYDAVGVLVDSMKRAGIPADGDYSSEAYRTKLRDAIATTKDFQGVTAPITIGPDRNPIKPAVILQVHGDGFKFVKLLNP